MKFLVAILGAVSAIQLRGDDYTSGDGWRFKA